MNGPVIGRAVPNDSRTLAADQWFDVLGFRYRHAPGEQVAVRYAGTVNKSPQGVRFVKDSNADAQPVWLSSARFHIHLTEGND